MNAERLAVLMDLPFVVQSRTWSHGCWVDEAAFRHVIDAKTYARAERLTETRHMFRVVDASDRMKEIES